MRKMVGWFAPQKKKTVSLESSGSHDSPAYSSNGEEWVFDPLAVKGVTESQSAANFLEKVEEQHFDNENFLQNAKAFQLAPYLEKSSLLTRAKFAIENRWIETKDSFTRALNREYELGSLFNFVPVFVGLGIIAYFSAPQEPSLVALVLTLVVMSAITFKIRSRGMGYLIASMVFCTVLGMNASKYEIALKQMPVPLSGLTAKIEGVVVAVDQNQRGAPRYLIRPTKVEDLTAVELPRTIRLSSASKHPPILPGQSIAGLARMQPLSGPAFPHGYDFAFSSWMKGLGLSGFFMGAPKTNIFVPELSPKERAYTYLQSARNAITNRLRAGLPGEPGDIAAALITGDRSGLSKETQESLRRSGLAHILAISGLHMALVTLTVIWIARFVLVLLPSLASRYPVKKWAIVAGFITATLYLFISGAGIATQRAWIMITVMLAASLLDRRAITMRSVAIAALIILIVAPSSLFQPGFQMSFAAVAALVTVYRDWGDHKRKRVSSVVSAPSGWVTKLFSYFGGLSATSLIAGTATALIAMWHFHRVAPMGLVSNLIAMPLVSLFVMPLSLASMFLMPYGFEGVALRPLGVAITSVVRVAEWVNSYQFDFETGAKSQYLLIFSILFLVLLCGFRTRIRWFSIFPFFGIVLTASISKPVPDMIISQDGRSIAVRSALIDGFVINEPDVGELSLLYPNRGKFITDIWQRAYLPNRNFSKFSDLENCSKDQCWLRVHGKSVGIVYDPALLKEACIKADFLIAPRLWWVNCYKKEPELILKRNDFEEKGTHVVTFGSDKITINTAWPGVGEGTSRRPWLQRFDNKSRRYPPKRLKITTEPSVLKSINNQETR